MSNDLELANRAIGLCGGEPIMAFDGTTPISDFAQFEWPDTVKNILGSYRWVFCEAFAQATQIAGPPEGCPLAFAFQRPVDLGGAIHAARNGPDALRSQLVATIQTADYIACDSAPLWLEYTKTIDVGAAPSWFTELLVKAFAAKVALRVRRADLSQKFEAEAFGTPEQNRQGGLWLAATQADSRNAPARTLEYADHGALAAARYGVGVGLGSGGPNWPNNGLPVQVVISGT